MKNIKSILLLFAIAAFLSFSLMGESDRYISILESSEQMKVSKFSLEDQKTLLKLGKDYEFYVTVKVRNVKGKEVKNYKKVKKGELDTFLNTPMNSCLPIKKCTTNRILSSGAMGNWIIGKVLSLSWLKGFD